MPSRKKIQAICGSTRARSTNLDLIRSMQTLATDFFDIVVLDGLSEVPHFNPDLDTADPPKAVTTFRKQLREADGILICTPEYAMGVPGTLKNAIDWTVSSCEFSQKPTALVTASSMGQKGHAALLETLKIIEADISEQTQLLIPFIKTKMGDHGGIKDLQTLYQVKAC